MSQKIFKLFFISLLVVVLSGCFLVNKAGAQNNSASDSSQVTGITISPPLREMNLKAGQNYVQQIKLSNPSQNIVELYPLAMNFSNDGDTGKPKFSNASSDDGTYSLAKWISYTQSKIALAPQQVADFSYNINVPADAEAGGHYGVVFFSTQPPEIASTSSQVSISSMIGCLLLITVDGDIEEDLSLSSFEMPKIVFTSNINISTRLTNNGNVHQKPVGEILIQSSLARRTNVLSFNAERGNILPASSRMFSNSWKSNIFKDIGPHKIQLNLTYGEENSTINAEKTVWFIPWWLILSLLIVILLIVIFIFVRSHRKRHDFNKYFKVPDA